MSISLTSRDIVIHPFITAIDLESQQRSKPLESAPYTYSQELEFDVILSTS